MVGSHQEGDIRSSRLRPPVKRTTELFMDRIPLRKSQDGVKLKHLLYYRDQERRQEQLRADHLAPSPRPGQSPTKRSAEPMFTPVVKERLGCTSSSPTIAHHCLGVPIQSYLTGKAQSEHLEASQLRNTVAEYSRQS